MTRIREAILVFIFSGILFFLYFLLVIPEGISNINTYFFSTNHDGIKNYFTYLYYLKYDSGFHFSGMAYPYGDLITFTDNQPLLALTVKTLGIGAYSVALFNLLLLLAFPLTTLLVYKLLKHYGTSGLYGFAIAITITILNPQVERLMGHYALAYSFVIPLLWLIDIKTNASSKKTGWIITGILVVLGLTFLHVYYLAVSLIFFTFSGIARFLLRKSEGQTVRSLLLTYVPLALAPVLIFKIFMSFIDPVSDRVAIPFGFLNYRATYKSIFFNDNSPLYQLTPAFIKVGKYELEGRAYLGFFALFFSVFVIYTVVRSWIRNKDLRFEYTNLTEIKRFNPYIILGILALCIAAAFPFYMPPFDIIIEWVSPLAQFRSPGRFAWIFFFIFNLYFYLYLVKLYNEPGKLLKRVLLPFVIALSLYEGIAAGTTILRDMNSTALSDKFFRQDLEPEIGKYKLDKSKYQALIAFPFTTIGNEKGSLPGSDRTNFYEMKVAYHTGLPLVNYMMSRTGVKTGLQATQFTSNSFLPKEYLDAVSDHQPFLLMVADTLLNTEEREMIACGKPLFTWDSVSFYELTKKDLLALYNRKQAAFNALPWRSSSKPQVFYADSTADGTEPYFMLKENCNVKDLFDNNEQVMNKEGSEMVFEGNLPDTDSLTASFWGRNQNSIYGFPVILIWEYDAEGKVVMHYNSHMAQDIQLCQATRRVEYTFKPKNAANLIKIQIKGKRFNYGSFVIQQAKTQVKFKDKYGNWFWNNYPQLPQSTNNN